MTGQPWWDYDNPGRCDRPQVQHFADVLTRRREHADELTSRVEKALDSVLAEGLSSQFSAAWTNFTRGLVPEFVTATNDALTRTVAAAREYEAEVAEVQASTARAHQAREDVETQLRAFREQSPQYQESDEGRRRLMELEEARELAAMNLRHTAERRRGLDNRLMHVLNDIPGMGGFPAESLVYAGALAAQGGPQDGAAMALFVLETAELTEEFNEFWRQNANNTDPADQEWIAAEFDRMQTELSGRFATFGDDPDLWSAYLRSIGGEEMMRFAQLGPEFGTTTVGDGSMQALRIQLAMDVREGLSLASSTWGPEESARFTDQMINGAALDVKTDIGFFFSDIVNAPMGENLTVAMVEKMDALERLEGDTSWGIARGDYFGGASFSWAAQGALPDYGVGTLQEGLAPGHFGDPSAMIMRTLGLYPEAAQDFLLGGAETEFDADGDGGALSITVTERMEYWFHDRDSSSSGYLGPLSMLEGAQHIEGGLLSGEPHSLQAFEDTAKLMNDSMTLLFDEESNFRVPVLGWEFGQGDGSEMSPDAMEVRAGETGASAQTLARVLGNYMPMFAEVPLTESGLTNDAFVDRSVVQYAEFDKVPVANISPEELGRAIRAISGDPHAIATLERATLEYQHDVFNAMDNGNYSASEGLQRVAATTAIRDAMVAGRIEEVALAKVDAVNSLFDWGGLAAGKAGSSGGADFIGIAGTEWDVAMRNSIGMERHFNAQADLSSFQGRLTPVLANATWYELGEGGQAIQVDPMDSLGGAVRDYESVYQSMYAEIYRDL